MTPRKNPLFYIINLFAILALGIAPVRAAPAPAPEVAEQQAAFVESQNLAQVQTQQTAIAIAAGGFHTCALTGDGGVKCWGQNNYGQLGDNASIDRSTPVDVSELASGVTAITAGDYHTCALTTNGGVKCWGYNFYGQLGDGTTTNYASPVNVSGLSSGVMAISAGRRHTCALTSDGGVKCWGANNSTPVDVSGLSNGVTAITAGGRHTCALTTSGGVKCWGDNRIGQLGDGTTIGRDTPVDVNGLSSGVATISAGEWHTCALTSGGGVKCWGHNTYGQLGNNTSTSQSAPVDVSGLASGVVAISAGYENTCALSNGGGAKCWGGNDWGQLGDDTTVNRYTPVDVNGLSNGAVAISAGREHTCTVIITGSAKCWGGNTYGQLGDGTTSTRSTPIDVNGLSSGVVAISTSGGHTCAVINGGGGKCWGWNQWGQLGDDTTIDRYAPINVSGLFSGVVAFSAGITHTCALTSGGGVKCWGRNNLGQLGDGTTTQRHTPVNVNGLSSGVMAVSAGHWHTCVLTSIGGVKCWGSNSAGQLGDDSTTDRHTPVDVDGLASGVVAISAGGEHTCAVTNTGGVKCWGFNSAGQLGVDNTIEHYTPVDVNGLSSGVVMVSAGLWHTCALTNSGGVKCWGDNSYGQLGDGTTSTRSTPLGVNGLSSGVVAISAGYAHTCALTNSGGVKCWGANYYGHLGDGTRVDRYLPVGVHSLSSGVMAISAGYGHTCALTNGGGVKCWGGNSVGQLGLRPSLTPVDVVGFGGLTYRLYFPLIQR